MERTIPEHQPTIILNPIRSWKNATEPFTEHQESTRQVYDGVLLNAWKDAVKMPDGKTAIREYLRHPGAALVLPVFNNGDILLIGQYRYAARRAFLELPAGKLDTGELPETTAMRELEEEAGITCKHLEKIGILYPCIGYSDEIIHIYTGWGISETGQNPDEDEFLARFRVPFTDAVNMVDSDEINDAKTVIALLRGHRWWQKNGPFPIT